MRTDLQSMTNGRAMAQASHAANAFVHENPKVKGLKEWQKQTPQGYGTAIVMASTLERIEIYNDAIKKSPYKGKCVGNILIDPEYGIKTTKEIYNLMHMKMIYTDKSLINPDGSVIVFRSEVTCSYIFGTREVLKPLLGALSLHP